MPGVSQTAAMNGKLVIHASGLSPSAKKKNLNKKSFWVLVQVFEIPPTNRRQHHEKPPTGLNIQNSSRRSAVIELCCCLPSRIHIGGLFEHDDDENELAFRVAVDRLNMNDTLLKNSRIFAMVEKLYSEDTLKTTELWHLKKKIQNICTLISSVRNSRSSAVGCSKNA
ncbi:uncharacterized protein CEXT_502981 [Caerostris extrusa]|uniref:Uncharacterized protein n=1 Tax=Caerostris extrusa TaxID=172846 RepID=A0AAV4W7V5_CAEEX|nr:uncharacterized protein CEXT_502981 [Caerostris extrusa]